MPILLSTALLALPLPANANGEVFADPGLRRLNVRVHPLGILYGVYGATVDFGPLPWLTVGPAFALFKEDNDLTTVSLAQYGLSATAFFNGLRLETGWIARLTQNYLSANVSPLLASGQTIRTYSAYTAQVTGGYFWALPNGLNLSGGAGVVFSSAALPLIANSGPNPSLSQSYFVSHFEPTVDLNLGWEFR